MPEDPSTSSPSGASDATATTNTPVPPNTVSVFSVWVASGCLSSESSLLFKYLHCFVHDVPPLTGIQCFEVLVLREAENLFQ